jgi:hypothetical protein
MKAVAHENDSIEAVALVDGCRFVDNERGLTVVGPYRNLTIVNSHFLRNQAAHAGAGILVLVNRLTEIVIDNCTFVGNIAGTYRNYYPVEVGNNETVQLVGDEVHLNTDCCKGVVMLVGKGGAMRIQRGSVTLRRSRFIGNTATLLGGSIFVDIEGELKVWDTYFENVGHNVTSSAVRSDDGNEAVVARRGRSVEHQHAQQGDIIYSDGKIKIAGVRLVAVSSSNGLSVFRHSGSHWSLAINDVSIRCPVGYDLRTTNSTAYGVSAQGLRRSYYLDQLSYYCESCPRNRYSLDYGYLNYTMIMRDFVYFTLLINSSRPKPSHIGTYDHHKIRCMDCPHGGQCDQGIVPVANFWGYVIDANGNFVNEQPADDSDAESARNRSMSMVRFQHCPKGYCRSTGPQLGVGSCADRREGPLCGRCGAGFSEAWFSTICVPNESCGPPWLYPFTVILGLLYSAFLVYQADLKRFIFAGPLLGRCSRPSPFRRSDNRRNIGERQAGGCGAGALAMTSLRQQQQQPRNGSSHQMHRRHHLSTWSTANDCEQLKMNELHRDQVGSSLPSANVEAEKSADDDGVVDGCGNVIPPDNNASSSSSSVRPYSSGHLQKQLPRQFRRSESKRSTACHNSLPSPSCQSAVDYGCIVTLVYYLQDALLLRVKTVFPSSETRVHYVARSVIAGLFRFELDLFELLHRTCAMPDMTPVPKLLSQALLIPFIMFVLGSVYACSRLSAIVGAWLRRRRRRASEHPPAEREGTHR